jgi:hypothetical protein
MYQENIHIQKPANENAVIWRYLDFTKLVSLLESCSLYFCRADKLGDPFEGSYSEADLSYRKQTCERFRIPFEKLNALLSGYYKSIREHTFVNCWHISEHESAAMWKLYLKSDEGIAIKSSFKDFSKCFIVCPEHDVFIGMVNYLDYKFDVIKDKSIGAFFSKRKSFDHEKEIRAVIQTPQIIPLERLFENGMISETSICETGIYIPVSLETLIHKFYVSPTSPDWFKNLIESVVKKYGLEKDVRRSSLIDDPIF